MDIVNEFEGMDVIRNNVSEPPEKVRPVKPSREDLMAYWHDGLVSPKPLDKHYSYAKIKKILGEEYGCEIKDISEYKGTRWYSRTPHKLYTIIDQYGETKVEECSLYQIGKWLEDQGEYTCKKDVESEETPKRYKADIYYIEWCGKPGHFHPNGRYLLDIYIEERGCFYYVYDEFGNLKMKKKKGTDGTKVVRKH